MTMVWTATGSGLRIRPRVSPGHSARPSGPFAPESSQEPSLRIRCPRRSGLRQDLRPMRWDGRGAVSTQSMRFGATSTRFQVRVNGAPGVPRT
jgi:hypothetical protein